MAFRPGEVEIDLNGERVVLRPTPNVLRVLSKRYGGFQPLLASLSSLDFDAFVTVIAVGAGIEGKGVRELENKVYEAGLISLLGDVSKFVVIVSNGGRPLDEDAERDAEDASKNGE